jgi:hypothetical protein
MLPAVLLMIRVVPITATTLMLNTWWIPKLAKFSMKQSMTATKTKKFIERKHL